MAPFTIEEDLDVLEQVTMGDGVVRPLAVVGQLGLEQMKERLGHGIVPAVALATHALYEAAPCHGPPQSDQHDDVVQSRTECPADHASRMEIDEDCQIQPARADTQVGQIAHPHLVGPLCGEVALQPIRRHRVWMLRVGRDSEATARDRTQPQIAHTPGDTTVTDLPALSTESLRDFGTTRTLSAGGKHRLDGNVQLPRLKNSCARGTALSRIEAAAGNLHDATQHRHRVLRPLRLDEVVPHIDSLAKKAAAFFRMSRSCDTRANSRRRLRISSSRSLT